VGDAWAQVTAVTGGRPDFEMAALRQSVSS